MIQLQRVLEAAEQLQNVCQRQVWRFCFIGGIAVQRWGEPRLTIDADLTLLTGFGSEEAFVDTLLATFPSRREDSREFALRHRVLLVQTSANVPLDIAFGALPFEERSVERASPWVWEQGHSLITCSAEDLLVHKIFAGRERDWSDAEGLLIRQCGKLKLDLVRSELRPLLELKGETQSLERLETLIGTVDRRLRAGS